MIVCLMLFFMCVIIPDSGAGVKGFFDFFADGGPLHGIDKALRAVELDDARKARQEEATVEVVQGHESFDDCFGLLFVLHACIIPYPGRKSSPGGGKQVKKPTP